MVDIGSLAQVLIGGLLSGSIWALVALGLNLIYGVMRIINIAHGELLMLGGFGIYALWTAYGVHPVLGMVLLIPLFFILGLTIQYSLIKRLLERDFRIGNTEMMSLIMTFGLVLILQNVARLIWSTRPKVVDAPPLSDVLRLSGTYITYSQLLAICTAVFCMVLLYLLMTRTEFGRAMRATVQNKRMAEVNGINTQRIYLITFGISATLASIAGVMVSVTQPITPFVGFDFVIMGFLIIVVGGLGRFTSAVIVAFVLGMIGSISLFAWGTAVREILVLLIMGVALYVYPEGVLSESRV